MKLTATLPEANWLQENEPLSPVTGAPTSAPHDSEFKALCDMEVSNTPGLFNATQVIGL